MSEKRYISDIAFTPQVKLEQKKRGSRETYRRMIEQSDWQTTVTSDLETFISRVNSFYLATSSSQGQPYIQHRGGPAGFLKALDAKTLAFADFAGNQQYISTGNLNENDQAHIFIIDYANKRRVKIWGRARMVENDDALLQKLTMDGYRAKPERAFVLEITAWDINCPQHIPQKVDLADAQEAITLLKRKIAALEEENTELKGFLKTGN